MIKPLNSIIKFVLSASLIVILAITVLADKFEMPLFVLDEAGILSDDDERSIEEINAVIFEQTGCRFSIVTADFLGGESIEQFSSDLYHQNEMGINGLLFVISVAEENYHVIQGTELEQYLSNEVIDTMLQTTVEELFESGEYSCAVKDFHEAAAEKLGEIYNAMIDPDEYRLWQKEQRMIEEQRAIERGRWLIVFIVSVAAAAVFTSGMIISIVLRKNRRKRT